MVMFLVSCLNQQGWYQEYSFGCQTMETGFDLLILLTQTGWLLLEISLYDEEGRLVRLPTEAFDGQPLAEPISQLQRQWEALLAAR